ncbi:MAG: class I adenylate-forming enzyme family protein [Promethearchaeota archaeon]
MMKDYSEWKPVLDYEHESQWVNPNRPWFKHRTPEVGKSLRFEPIPVHEFIKTAINKYPNNVCVYDKASDKKYTYRELGYYADRIANALHELGVGKGDAVGIMSGNCPEFLFCYLGVLETGAILVPINPLLTESDVIHIVRETGIIKVIFAHKANYRIIKKTRQKIEVPHIILIATDTSKDDAIVLDDFINDKAPKPPDVDIDPVNDIAALLFTGGTTGLPKGVMLTHNNLVFNALQAIIANNDTFEAMEESLGNEVNLCVLPLCHAMGFTVLNIMLYLAWMLLMLPFDPADVMEAIEQYRIKVFVAVPVMFQMVINHPDFTERDLSCIEVATSGSAALAPDLARRWEEVVGIKVGQAYGLTEVTMMSHGSLPWLPEINPESIGVPVIDTDVIIANPETLEELKSGEIGEILIKGPQVMKGYWNRPEETAKDVVNGWLRTGDLGRMDENGYYYIEGRTKDMIKYKSYKVMAKEVEEKLMEHPAILEAGVIGVPDPNIGETIKAFIVLKKDYKDENITEREIIEWSKGKLAAYKYPRQVEFIKSLPRTPIGKIFRRKLREMELEKKEKSLAPL